MLEIRPIMNTPTQEVFAFKACCGIRNFDHNLEIHVRNVGSSPVVVPSVLDLEGDSWTERIDTLMPHGAHRIDPGEIMAFYCYMDETLWARAKRIIFHDREGREYSVSMPDEGGG